MNRNSHDSPSSPAFGAISVILTGMWYLTVVIISNSLLTYDVEHLTFHMLTLFARVSVQVFCLFLNQVVFLLLSFKRSSYILENSIFIKCVSFANIFSQSVVYLLILMTQIQIMYCQDGDVWSPYFWYLHSPPKWQTLSTVWWTCFESPYYAFICIGPHNLSLKKCKCQPWLVWLSGLGILPQTKRSQVGFLVRTHGWVAGQPWLGIDVSLAHRCFSPSPSPSLPL